MKHRNVNIGEKTGSFSGPGVFLIYHLVYILFDFFEPNCFLMRTF